MTAGSMLCSSTDDPSHLTSTLALLIYHDMPGSKLDTHKSINHCSVRWLAEEEEGRGIVYIDSTNLLESSCVHG